MSVGTESTAIATRPFDSLAITELKESKFIALHPDSEAVLAMRENMAGGETMTERDLQRVPLPTGGGTTFNFDLLGEPTSERELVGVLVFYATRGVLWPHEKPSGKMPVLRSLDLLSAEKVSDDLGDIDPELLKQCELGTTGWYDWKKLPYNKFGTAANGVGKRAKESRLMAILRPGEVWPLLINATPGSLKTIVPFVKKLPVPHFRAVVSLTLQKVQAKSGEPYAQLVPRLVGTLSKIEGEALRAMYTNPLRDMVIEEREEDYVGSGDE